MRLGFIGQNGSGKTNVLNAIALREVLFRTYSPSR
jgi:recombinational DNA repair ATPase RecF